MPDVPEPQAEVAPASSPLLTRLTVSDKSGGKCNRYRNQSWGGRQREGEAECKWACTKQNRKLYSRSAYSRPFTSVVRIHRKPCWVEIALDASALLLTRETQSKSANPAAKCFIELWACYTSKGIHCMVPVHGILMLWKVL